MNNHIKGLTRDIRIRHLFFLFILDIIILKFLLYTQNTESAFFNNTIMGQAIFTSALTAILSVFFFLIALSFINKTKHALNYSLVILSPIALFFLWNPYDSSINFLLPIFIIAVACSAFFFILHKNDYLMKIRIRKEKIVILSFIIAYSLIFVYIAFDKFNSYTYFNSKDFAIYNQTFWNTIHGRLFENSTYGSNFTCHNSPFFFILVPLYYLMPHPMTLVAFKILLLSFSAIPFYLIAKNILNDMASFVLTLAYLLYPFIISQNLNPPHEITYSPFFILFTYYFFMQRRFFAFLLFLILSLSIKEHLSLLAIFFGILAIIEKRETKWFLTPLIFGIAWGIASLIVLSHFLKIYSPHSDAAWFIADFKRNFLSNINNVSHYKEGLYSSGILSLCANRDILLLFLPLCVIPTFLNPVFLLALPELLINLISCRQVLFSPLLHYNITVSCFLFISSAYGIKKIADMRIIEKFGFKKSTTMMLLSSFILTSTLIHSYTWIAAIRCKKDKNYINTVNSALSLIPKTASIMTPDNIAVHVSSREKYYIISALKTPSKIELTKPQTVDYILLDKKQPSLNIPTKNYLPIFNQEDIALFKKK